MRPNSLPGGWFHLRRSLYPILAELGCEQPFRDTPTAEVKKRNSSTGKNQSYKQVKRSLVSFWRCSEQLRRRQLRRFKRRWKVERLFVWMHNFRRLLTRWEYHIENFLGFVHLACLHMLLRHL
ncbi:MAG: transposase [Silvibacterium sp.]